MNRFGDAPVNPAPSPARRNRFGDAPAGGDGVPTPNIHAFARQVTQDGLETAAVQAQAEIRNRESGMELVPVRQNPDGSVEWERVQVRPPTALSPSEKEAIIRAQQAKYAGVPLPQHVDPRLNAAGSFMNDPTERASNIGVAAGSTLAQLGIGLYGVVDPAGAAAASREVALTTPYNPDTYTGFAGEAAGNVLPLVPAMAVGGAVAPWATAGVLGASQFGQVRAEVARLRQQGVDISPAQELTAAALSAAAELVFERAGIGAIMGEGVDIARRQVANAVINYARAAGINATEEMATQIAQNAVERYVLQQETDLAEGVAKAGATGGVVGAVGRGVSQGINALRRQPAAQQPGVAPYDLADPNAQPPVAPAPVDDGRIPVETSVSRPTVPLAREGDPNAIPLVPQERQAPGTETVGPAAGPQLPRLLAEKVFKTRVNEGANSRGVALEFDSAVDKALYALAQPRAGKVQAEATKYLQDIGMSPQDIETGLAQVKQAVDALALTAEGDTVRIAPTFQNAPIPLADPTTGERAAGQIPVETRANLTAPIPLKGETDAVQAPAVAPAEAPVSAEPVQPEVQRSTYTGPVLKEGEKQGTLFLPEEEVNFALSEASKNVRGFKPAAPANRQQAEAREAFGKHGVQLVFYDGEGRGVRLSNNPRVLFINRKNADADLQEAVAHEFMHELKASRPGLFQEFLAAIPESVRQEARQWYAEAAARQGLQMTDAKLDEEAVTTTFGRIAKNNRVWQAALGQKPGLLQKLMDFFRAFAAKLGSSKSRMVQQAIKTFEATLNAPVGGAAIDTRSQPAAQAPARDVPFRTTPQRRYVVAETTDFLPDPDPRIREEAAEYNRQVGLPTTFDTSYPEVDVERAKQIAEWYDKAEHSPNDPEVREAYEAMKRETLAQYRFLEERGVRFEPYFGEGEPYANSREMLKDVRENRHLYFFLTESGFGSEGQVSDHPLLEKTGITLNGHELVYNDVFRAVHDYFGHAKEGTGFGPRGEEAAWRSHSQMYTPTARKAMSAETRGQNSWVNYGPHGEHNRTNPKETIFADQKAVVMPDQWVRVEKDQTELREAAAAQEQNLRRTTGIDDLARLRDEARDLSERQDEQLRQFPPAGAGRTPPQAQTPSATSGLRTLKEYLAEIPPGTPNRQELARERQLADHARYQQEQAKQATAPTVSPAAASLAELGRRFNEVPAEQAGEVLDRFKTAVVQYVRNGLPQWVRIDSGYDAVSAYYDLYDTRGEEPERIGQFRVSTHAQRYKGPDWSFDTNDTAETHEKGLRHLQRLVQSFRQPAPAEAGGTAPSAQDASFLPEDKRFDSVELRRAIEEMEMFPGSRPQVARKTVLSIAKQLQARTRRIAKPAKSRKGRIDRFVEAAVREIKHQLTRPNSGLDWYDENLARYKETMQSLRPELRDETEWRLFSLIVGKLSQGNQPFPNLVYADRIYRIWRQTGEMPLTQASGKNFPGNDIANGLKKIDALVKHFGREGAVEWALSKHTIADIRKVAKELDLPGQNNIAGKATDEEFGIIVLGPKIGPFSLMIQNIDGVTVKDLWFSRTWNRIQGTLVEKTTEGGESVETTVDAPRSYSERAEMEEAMEKVAEITGLSPKAAQAVLWFYEKELYHQLGSELDLGNYADAADRIKRGETYGEPDPRVDNTEDRQVSRRPAAREAASSRADSRGGTGDQEALFLPSSVEAAVRRGGNLPPEVVAANDTRQGRIAADTRTAEFRVTQLEDAIRADLGKPARRLTPKQLRALDAALKGDTSIKLTPNVRAAVDAMREHVDSLTSEIINSGLVDPALAAVLQGNLGQYLNRSYRVFDDPEWAKKIPQPVMDNAVRFIERQLAAQGRPVEHAKVYIEELLADWKAGGVDSLFSGAKLGSKNLSILKERKDIAPEIRALMGEYTNPFVNYAKSIAKMSSLLANHTFLEQVKAEGMGKWLFTDETAKPGFTTRIAAEGSAAMAPLNGLRTSPEIAQAFADFNRSKELPGWLRILVAANFLAKSSKTVFSLMTQVRNLVGQPYFNLLSGHYRISKYGQSFKALAADLRKRAPADLEAYVTKLTRLGILGNGVQANELLADLKDMGLDKADLYSESGFIPAMKRGVRAALMIPQTAYQVSDNLGKVYGFENELARMKEAHPDWTQEQQEAEAAERVLNTYPTYSRVPPAVQALRRQPFVGPFVAFWYESFRTVGNSIAYAVEDMKGNSAQKRHAAERIAGITAVMAGSYAIQELTKALLGIDDEEEEDLRKFLPSWSKGNTLLFTGKERGALKYIDISALNPYSALADVLNVSVGGQGDVIERMGAAVQEFFTPLTSEQIFTAVLLDVARNKKPSGARVYNPEDSLVNRWTDALGHIFTAIEPGTVSRFRNRILPGLRGEETSFGDRIDPVDEITAEVTGVKKRSLNFASGLSFQARTFGQAQSDITALFLRELNRPGNADETIVDAYGEMEARRFEQWADMHSKAQAALRSGLSRQEVFNALVQGGVSQSAARAIILGKYVPYNLQGESVKAAYKRRGSLPLKELGQVRRQYTGRALAE